MSKAAPTGYNPNSPSNHCCPKNEVPSKESSPAKGISKGAITTLVVGILVALVVGGFGTVGLLQSYKVISISSSSWLAIAIEAVGSTPHFWSLWTIAVGGAVVGLGLIGGGAYKIHPNKIPTEPSAGSGSSHRPIPGPPNRGKAKEGSGSLSLTGKKTVNDSLMCPPIHMDLVSHETQVAQIFSGMLPTILKENYEQDEAGVIRGSPENIEILTEILGRPSDEPDMIQLSLEEQNYLASQAIFPLLTPEGQKGLLKIMYDLLVPYLDKNHALKYLRTYNNDEISLSQKEGKLIISVKEIILTIDSQGNLVVRGTGEDLNPVSGSLITLLWHHMAVVLAELNPTSSKKFASQAFNQVQGLFSKLEQFTSKAQQLEGSKIDPALEGRYMTVFEGLPLHSIQQKGLTATKYIDSHCKDTVPKFSPEEGSITYALTPLVNPVIASQDSKFTISITTQQDTPPIISCTKSSDRGHFGTTMARDISFQKGVEEGSIRVSITKADTSGDWLEGSDKRVSTYYEVTVTEGRWHITFSQTDSWSQQWSHLFAFSLQDDGTWQHMGHFEEDIGQKKPSVAEYSEDLDFIIRSLLTLQGIYTSPYTLMEGIELHLTNQQPISIPMLQMLSQIKQGGSQSNYAVIQQSDSALRIGFDAWYHFAWNRYPPPKQQLQG